jgi:hypothetical protein
VTVVVLRNADAVAAVTRSAANRYLAQWEALPRCDALKRDTRHDYEPVHCRLPADHRSEDHWHPPRSRREHDIVWLDE